MSRIRYALVAASLLAACNQPTIQTPIRSFDAPSDVALVCSQYDAFGLKFDPLPLSECSPARKKARAYTDPTNPLGAQIVPGLQALVVQSARGELAYVDAEAGRIIDLAQQVPGFNFLYVGNQPEHVRASADGCRAAVSNAGSCDLAVVELPILYNLPRDPRRDGGVPEGYAGNAIRRVTPTVNGRPLGARPSWIEWAPENEPGVKSGASPPAACSNGTSFAWVAFPGCQLVAEINLDVVEGTSNVEVVRALRVTRDGVEPITDLRTVSCPAECAGAPAAPPVDVGDMSMAAPDDLSASAPADGGVVDAGTSPTAPPDLMPPPRLPSSQAFPSALALDFETAADGTTATGVGRLFISDPTSTRVWAIPIDAATGALGTPRAIKLTDDALGVDVARVSPRSPAGKFLYAVARDASVRVIDLDREVECETRPDPRGAIPTSAGAQTPILSTSPPDPLSEARALGCLPLGDPSTPARSALATSPGITLPRNALPRDVVFVHTLVPPVTDPRVQPPVAGPTTLVGDFAFIIGSDGRATPVTIFDACPAPNVPQGSAGAYTPACSLSNVGPSRATLPLRPGRPQPTLYERLAHRPRNGGFRYVAPSSCGDPSGAARLVNEISPATISIGATQFGGTLDGGTAALPNLVSLGVDPVDGAQCPTEKQTVTFFEWDRMSNETWSVAWEGAIPQTARTQGRLQPGGVLVDAGAAFCYRGVRAGDKVVLSGCKTDADCDYAQACVRDPAAPTQVTTGLCLDRDPEKRAFEERQCGPLLRGVRRYRILSARQAPAQGLVEDTLRIAEIAQPEHPAETHACAVDADCADVKVPVRLSGAEQQAATQCVADVDGARRCLRTCKPGDPSEAGACGVGFQCALSQVDGGGRCLRAPWDDRYVTPVGQGGFGCLRELQAYDVRAGESFLVTGSQTGMFTVLEPGADGECRIPPDRAATPSVRLRQARIPLDESRLPACFAPGGPQPRVIDAIVPAGDPSSNVCLASASASSLVVHFENPFLAFAVDVPRSSAPPDDFVLRFDVVGAGFPQSVVVGVDVIAQTPATAVVGPDGQTIFVLDQGKQSAATGLRGQLIRLFAPSLASDRSFVVR
jgi:hypothetical protein